jgi:hypothetical protein
MRLRGCDPVVIRLRKVRIGVEIRGVFGRFGTERSLVRIQSPRPSNPQISSVKQPVSAVHCRFLSGTPRVLGARGAKPPNFLRKTCQTLLVAASRCRPLWLRGCDPVVIRSLAHARHREAPARRVAIATAIDQAP